MHGTDGTLSVAVYCSVWYLYGMHLARNSISVICGAEHVVLSSNEISPHGLELS